MSSIIGHPGDDERLLSLGGNYTSKLTFHETIRFWPLAPSLEAKLAGDNWKDAKTRTGTQVSAQFAHPCGMLQM